MMYVCSVRTTHDVRMSRCCMRRFYIDDKRDIYTVRLTELLQSFGCGQHVTEPTHNAGHTLDLVITRSETVISELRVGDMISDHALIRFTLLVKTERFDAPWTTRRAWRRLSSVD